MAVKQGLHWNPALLKSSPLYRPLPRDMAERVSLVYVSDEEPGIRRRRSGTGFSYVGLGGKTIRDSRIIKRINALAIPPAWTDVWISADPDGHIQATGRDVKGRKQYRYHERWAVCRDEVKYGSLAEFASKLPDLRTQVDRDLRRHGLPRERVLAAVVWLLDNTMIRVGNEAYARDNKSFGLTTLKDRHVDVTGSQLRFAFKGKSGKEWKLRLTDRRIAKVVKGAQDIPGQQLFQYFEDDGTKGTVRSEDVNAYIREAIGEDFSSKHFRTWGGTVAAASARVCGAVQCLLTWGALMTVVACDCGGQSPTPRAASGSQPSAGSSPRISPGSTTGMAAVIVSRPDSRAGESCLVTSSRDMRSASTTRSATLRPVRSAVLARAAAAE